MKEKPEFTRGELRWLIDVLKDLATQEQRKAEECLSETSVESAQKMSEHGGRSSGLIGATSLVEQLLKSKPAQ